MIIPLIVVIPGLAYVIINDPLLMEKLGESGMTNLPTLAQADKYPWLMFCPLD